MKNNHFLILGMALLGMAGVILVRAVLNARETARDSVRLGHGCQLRWILGHYVDDKKCFPARYEIDSATNARASFFAVLSRWEDKSFAYRRGEPWNSPRNQELAGQHSHSSFSLDEHALFVAPNDLPTILADDQPRHPEEVADGLADTLLCASVKNSDVVWTEPRDLSWEWFCEHAEGNRDAGTVGFAPQYLLFADLAIYEVLKPLDEADFRALWTRDGGEVVTRDALVRAGFLKPRQRPADWAIEHVFKQSEN
jgi:hypothetical protein